MKAKASYPVGSYFLPRYIYSSKSVCPCCGTNELKRNTSGSFEECLNPECPMCSAKGRFTTTDGKYAQVNGREFDLEDGDDLRELREWANMHVEGEAKKVKADVEEVEGDAEALAKVEALAQELHALANHVIARPDYRRLIKQETAMYRKMGKQVTMSDFAYIVNRRGFNIAEASLLLHNIRAMGLGDKLAEAQSAADALAAAAGMIVTTKQMLGEQLVSAPPEIVDQAQKVLKSLKALVQMLNAAIKEEAEPPPEGEGGGEAPPEEGAE